MVPWPRRHLTVGAGAAAASFTNEHFESPPGDFDPGINDVNKAVFAPVVFRQPPGGHCSGSVAGTSRLGHTGAKIYALEYLAEV